MDNVSQANEAKISLGIQFANKVNYVIEIYSGNVKIFEYQKIHEQNSAQKLYCIGEEKFFVYFFILSDYTSVYFILIAQQILSK